MTVKLILALIVGFGVSVGVGAFLVPWLRSIKAGQSIKEIGPVWHMSKSGTPTMGGIMFIAAAATVCFSVGMSCLRDGEWAHVFVLFFGLVFGVIGFLDDYEKLRHHENTGLSAKMKFLLQLMAALVFLLLLRLRGYLSPNLYLPFWNTYVPISEPLYFLFAAFVIVGTVNAVNITDGVDGLLSGKELRRRRIFTLAIGALCAMLLLVMSLVGQARLVDLDARTTAATETVSALRREQSELLVEYEQARIRAGSAEPTAVNDRIQRLRSVQISNHDQEAEDRITVLSVRRGRELHHFWHSLIDTLGVSFR